MTAEQDNLLVRRLVEEAVNPGNPQVLDEVAKARVCQGRTRWTGPVHDSFPHFRMEIAGLVDGGEKAAPHFRCSGSHLRQRMSHPPARRHFQDIDEICIFRVSGGKLAGAFGVEDTMRRMRQLGLST